MPIMSPVSQAMVNADEPDAVRGGRDYVVFSNVMVGAVGTITFSWIGNPNVLLAGNNEGDLNALQLVFVSTSTNVNNATPNFGPNVFIFSPATSTATIQNYADGVFANQQNNQFGPQRNAFDLHAGASTAICLTMGGLLRHPRPGYAGRCGDQWRPAVGWSFGQMRTPRLISGVRAKIWAVPTNGSTMTWAVSQGHGCGGCTFRVA